MHWQDKRNLLKAVSPRKAANFLSLYSSYYKSQRTGKNRQKGMPFAISVEPTTACNLGCPECPSGLKQFTRPTGNMKHDFFLELVEELHRHLIYLNFYFQGEPYINPHFLEMVATASNKNIYTNTSTNAHFLNDENARKTVESGLNRLIISIDGSTQEVYEQYRKQGSLQQAMDGAANVVKWKKQLKSKAPHIVFQMLVVKPNEHQIEEVKQLAKKIGANEVLLKTAQVYHYEQGNPLIPENEKYARYKKGMDGTFSIKNPLENHCWKMWSSCVVTWDGLVVPCCFDKDATHQLGDLKAQNFTEVWRSERYNNFRSSVLRSRKEIDICTNCSEGSPVWA